MMKNITAQKKMRNLLRFLNINPLWVWRLTAHNNFDDLKRTNQELTSINKVLVTINENLVNSVEELQDKILLLESENLRIREAMNLYLCGQVKEKSLYVHNSLCHVN
jgi:predicted nuclease with TOPRIM domain